MKPTSKDIYNSLFKKIVLITKVSIHIGRYSNSSNLSIYTVAATTCGTMM